MSALPIVSIVGRPNVGKSSLFNRVIRKKIAVVDDTPGVTRDRNYFEASWNGIDFIMVDTGGLEPTTKELIPSEINKQVDVAVAQSDVIIFLVDALCGATDFDLMVGQRLRKSSADRLILAANKADSDAVAYEAADLYSLGCGTPLPISALHGRGVGDLLDDVCRIIETVPPKQGFDDSVDADLSLAILGRPNAGKSSLVNKLLNNERMIVTNIPGTTRDSIDSILTYQNKTIRLIDTAGLRKKSQVDEDIEYYANLRSLNSIRRANVCLLMVDTDGELGEQDLKIIKQIYKLKKGLILCWNKWDLIEKDSKTFDKLVADTRKTYMELQYTPMISISALTGQRVQSTLDTALHVQSNSQKRIKPSELRDNFFMWIKRNPHPFISGSQVRFLGVKQAKDDGCPHFTFFCTNPEEIVPAYKRFLINKFQKTYDFAGCPMTFDFKTAARPTGEDSYSANTFGPEVF